MGQGAEDARFTAPPKAGAPPEPDLAARVPTSTDAILLVDAAGRACLEDQQRRLVEAAIRAREDLLAVVSHDLKNPLGVILMNAALLRDLSPTADPRRWQVLIDRIERSARRMTRLVQDLLDLASIESGHLSVEPRPLIATALVSEMVESMQPLAESKALDLRSDLPAELPGVSADRSRLEQVLANLLGNAIKFTPPGGTIAVRAEAAGDSVRFSVSDTGPGIGERDLAHLFERFWQAPQTARQGTGLGLFIARGIVEAHGGRIWAESQLSLGTAFFFTLPAAGPAR